VIFRIALKVFEKVFEISPKIISPATLHQNCKSNFKAVGMDSQAVTLATNME